MGQTHCQDIRISVQSDQIENPKGSDSVSTLQGKDLSDTSPPEWLISSPFHDYIYAKTKTRSQTCNTNGTVLSLRCVRGWMTMCDWWRRQSSTCCYRHCERSRPPPWAFGFSSGRSSLPLKGNSKPPSHESGLLCWKPHLMSWSLVIRHPDGFPLPQYRPITPVFPFWVSTVLQFFHRRWQLVHTGCQYVSTCLGFSTSCHSVSCTVLFFADDALQVRCKVLQFSPHQRSVLFQHFAQARSAETTRNRGMRCSRGVTLQRPWSETKLISYN